MNLYLYIPLTSAHPAKILHSLIYGRLCAYKLQNSNTKDFVSMAVLLAKRLCLCGYSLCTMIPIFQAATNHLMERATHSLPSTEANQTQQPRTKYVNCANPMIFYLKYHPHGITRQNVHKVYTRKPWDHISPIRTSALQYPTPKTLVTTSVALGYPTFQVTILQTTLLAETTKLPRKFCFGTEHGRYSGLPLSALAKI
jgi:hypothetical protein